MPTLVGPRVGGAIGARIEVDYSVGYNADRTAAYVDANIIVASDRSLIDSTNDWTTWGQFGDAGGSGIGINHGGSGGRTLMRSVGGWFGPGLIGIGARVSRVEATGNIEAVLYIDPGPLAPFTDGNYTVQALDSQGFTSSNIIANGNGGSLVDVQMQVNTSPNDGGVITQGGSFRDVRVNGLTRYTVYYYRIRVANNTYGWGPWGPWKSVRTHETAPSVATGYSATAIGQTSARTTGIYVGDNGGHPLNNIRVMINTSPTSTGARIITNGSFADVLMDNLLPGTKYYFAIATANGFAWSAYGAWAEFTTLPGLMVKYQGQWRNAIPYVKYGGVWRQATRYVKNGGVWK